MFEGVWARCDDLRRRLRRLERREVHEFLRWIENTRNLIHVTVVVFVPLLIALVTFVSNVTNLLPFLLFPPLASGTYTLFAHPESQYASPRRFVGGMTSGALCGWVALELTARYWYHVDPRTFTVHAGAAGFGILLTGLVTWALDVEEPTAFSTALLVLVVDIADGSGGLLTDAFFYVLSVAVSTSLIAATFYVWRREFYHRRAKYLYRSTNGDDHVLVPLCVENDGGATTALAARLAAAHETGKVVLFDLVTDEAVSRREAELREGTEEVTVEHPDRDADRPAAAPAAVAAGGSRREGGATDRRWEAVSDRERAREAVVSDSASSLEAQADRIEAEFDVHCEVVVAGESNDRITAVRRAARETNCDLVAVPYECEGDSLSTFVGRLFEGDTDVLVHRSVDGRTDWPRVVVPVRKAGDTAHAMLEFAHRLAGSEGRVSLAHCIDRESRRRKAEEMLADLAETASAEVETRVARGSIEAFLERTATANDLVVMGASTDRSTASRLVSPPTFGKIDDLDCDVAIVDRGRAPYFEE